MSKLCTSRACSSFSCCISAWCLLSATWRLRSCELWGSSYHCGLQREFVLVLRVFDFGLVLVDHDVHFGVKAEMQVIDLGLINRNYFLLFMHLFAEFLRVLFDLFP